MQLQQKRSPRLVVKIVGFSFGVIAAVLAAVFLLLSWQTRERITRAIVENMEASQSRVADGEARRQVERRLQASILAESPTLKAAVDTYHAERAAGAPATQLLNTIQLEVDKLQRQLQAPVLSVTDVRGTVLATTGPRAGDWPFGTRVAGIELLEPAEALIERNGAVYLATVIPLTFGEDIVGDVILASPIDEAYAARLARDTSTVIAIAIGNRLVATSAPEPWRPALAAVPLPTDGAVTIDGDEVLVRRLLAIESMSVFALGSVGDAVRSATAEAAAVLLVIACGALVLGAFGSWWLARTLAAPIEQLRQTLRQMADARDFERSLQPSGASLELDALTVTFDDLRAAVVAAEAESEEAYLGVIGALAAALDARDPYTAGHSDRVARLSVAIGRAMDLSESDLEVLHLGALLHDIGKIGVSDAVLRKPGTLTDSEFEQIRQHPGLGARILRPLNFLAEHIAIVELHHERPDGQGYPHGLRGDDIPLFARIVHVADAFDAMVTARAYRPGRPTTEAIAELWRHAGTSFDAAVVQALTTLPAESLHAPAPAGSGSDASQPSLGGSVLPFRLRASGAARLRRSAS